MLVRSIVVAAVLAVLGIVMLVEASQVEGTQSRQIVSAVGVIAIVIGAIDLLAAMIRRSGAEFAVTNKRVIFKTGVMRRSSEEIFLNKVESVTVDEGFPGPGAELRDDQRPRYGRHARALPEDRPRAGVSPARPGANLKESLSRQIIAPAGGAGNRLRRLFALDNRPAARPSLMVLFGENRPFCDGCCVGRSGCLIP